MEFDLFSHLVQKGGPVSVEELAKPIQADPALLGRLLRHVAAMGYIKEVGEDAYEATNFTKAMTIPIIGDGYPCL